MSDALLIRISWPAIFFPRHQIQVQELIPEADLRGQGKTKLPEDKMLRFDDLN